MPSQWVDFKELRERVDIAEVLRDCGVELVVKGDQATAFCPLPGHRERSHQRSRSFSVNLKRGIFHCFGCQAKGNVLELFARLQGLDPGDTQQLREAGLQMYERFIGEPTPKTRRLAERSPRQRQPSQEEQQPEEPEDARPRVINAPLDFQLQNLDSSHEYLAKRGLTPETVAHFGLGFCARGLMKGRVAIPLHDHGGRLIGYAGRLVDDEAISDDNPKYRFPGPREKEGTVFEFRKSDFLFNGWRIGEDLDHLIVVEGFFASIWLHQSGFSNVVALMGSSCSARQGELIARHVSSCGIVWIMPDGDPAGEGCAHSVFAEVGAERAVRWVRMPEGLQPDDLEPSELENLLAMQVS